MDIKSLKKLFPMGDEEIEVNATEQLEQWYFQHGHRDHDYREQAIEACLKHGLPLSSTTNNGHEMCKRFVRLMCPCGTEMTLRGGGGTAAQHTAEYRCRRCGTTAELTFPLHGIVVRPKVAEEKGGS